MKKIFAAVLSFAMAFSLVACGGSAKKSDVDPPKKTEVAFITRLGYGLSHLRQFDTLQLMEFGHELVVAFL